MLHLAAAVLKTDGAPQGKKCLKYQERTTATHEVTGRATYEQISKTLIAYFEILDQCAW